MFFQLARRALTSVLSVLTLSSGDPQSRVTLDSSSDPNATYLAYATRAIEGTPTLDGRLDEEVWSRAAPITGFIQREPNEGEPASERTEVRVVYDERALYVGVRAHDSDPAQVIGRLTRRDEWSPSDWVAVSIDSYRDRRTAFEFWVNPAGVERDIYRYEDTREDLSWDAVWDVAARVDEEGWVAEFRIPFSQLRFSEAEEQVWGFNVTRVVQRKNETAMWKAVPKEGSGWVSEYGELTGLREIDPGRRLEALPYVLAQEGFAPSEVGNPFETGREFDGKVGMDIKYGLTNNLTLDLTVNPDFGQVEADPSVVNLSVFETQFQDKRPFFIEGSGIFDFPITDTNGGGQPLFYSRRIGRSPQGSADARGGYVDRPRHTAILGAAKLSGKTSSGWSIGVMDAMTAEEKADVVDAEGDSHQDIVEPFTNYGVLRVQRDFREGKSAVGGIFTSVNRSLPLRLDFLRSSAYTLGADARHRFWNGNWEINGKLVGSYVRGSSEAMLRTQRSSSRYYQRPDADHLELDPDRNSLFGTAGTFGLSKTGGGHWRTGLGLEWISPGFEANDVGFQPEADLIRSFLWAGYRSFQPGRIFRDYTVYWNGWNFGTFGGERTAIGTNINGSFRLLSYWGGWGGINRNFEALSTRVLRGGPAMKRPGAWNVWYGIHSDNRKAVAVEAGGWLWNDDERSDAGGFWAYVSLRPFDNAQLSLGPQYDWNRDDWQFVASANALGSDRYVIAALDQKTIRMNTRLDWTFTPNLSLQLYAQPFISSGTYESFREVVAPRADAYADRFAALGDALDREGELYRADLDRDGSPEFSFQDPNFTRADLRSTVVLRWEYLSGSALFLVWQQNRSRSDFDGVGRFRPGRDFGELMDAPGENVFLVKLNYYLSQ